MLIMLMSYEMMTRYKTTKCCLLNTKTAKTIVNLFNN